MKMLHSFLGRVSFYRVFNPHASMYTSPLSNLLRKDNKEPLVWTKELPRNVEHHKSALHSQPISKLPNASLTFALKRDASNLELGAVLFQYVHTQ